MMGRIRSRWGFWRRWGGSRWGGGREGGRGWVAARWEAEAVARGVDDAMARARARAVQMSCAGWAVC